MVFFRLLVLVWCFILKLMIFLRIVRVLGIIWFNVMAFWFLFNIKIWIGLFCCVYFWVGLFNLMILVWIGLLVVFILVEVLNVSGKVWNIFFVIWVNNLLVNFVIVFCLCMKMGWWFSYMFNLVGLVIKLFIFNIRFGLNWRIIFIICKIVFVILRGVVINCIMFCLCILVIFRYLILILLVGIIFDLIFWWVLI